MTKQDRLNLTLARLASRATSATTARDLLSMVCVDITSPAWSRVPGR